MFLNIKAIVFTTSNFNLTISGIQRKGRESDRGSGRTDPQGEVQQSSVEETPCCEWTGEVSHSAGTREAREGKFAAEEEDELVAAEAPAGTWNEGKLILNSIYILILKLLM